MIITFVVDTYKDRSNGTSMTAFRTARKLRELGHEVRIVATRTDKGKLDSNIEIGSEGERLYLVKERYIPIVTEISHKQHMIFGYPQESILREALSGSDIVHLYLPFALEIAALHLCRTLKIPYISAFHLQPQHISYNMNMDFEWFNDYLYRRFYNHFYRYTHHIHCPSKLMQDEIERIGYDAKSYVISNGFDVGVHGGNLEFFEDGLFHIASVGRFSKEKRQDVLIRAIANSKYAKNIKLHLHGLGPRESYLKKLCDNLLDNYEFGFVENSALMQKISKMHLYVHPAQVESEAISCLEAISLGVVPLIADSKISATNQFALDERSIFRTNDVENLSKKIEYWYENRGDLLAMREKYMQSAKKYALNLSVDRIYSLYKEAISDFRENEGLFGRVNSLLQKPPLNPANYAFETPV